jgi:hypothetical protein
MFEMVFARLRADLDAWKGRNERVRGG